MGKIGRFACVFVPMAMSIASLICIILVFSGQLNKNMSVQNDLYFFKANTKEFTSNPEPKDNEQLDIPLFEALRHAATTKDLKDFYQVGLWNYCEGDIDSSGKEKVTYCSPRKAQFWFNPIDVWELKNSTASQIFPDEMKNGIEAYRKVAKWMFVAYVLALCTTAAEIVIGIFAICSRWGSFVTTIVSTASSIFVIAAAITSTALYAALVGTFESVLRDFKIDASLGRQMLSVVWLAVAFSIGAGLFWLVSTCCCSGKSDRKKVVVEKTPYTYERVASPYLGASSQQSGTVPHNSGSHGPYEPFRHERV